MSYGLQLLASLLGLWCGHWTGVWVWGLSSLACRILHLFLLFAFVAGFVSLYASFIMRISLLVIFPWVRCCTHDFSLFNVSAWQTLPTVNASMPDKELTKTVSDCVNSNRISHTLVRFCFYLHLSLYLPLPLLQIPKQVPLAHSLFAHNPNWFLAIGLRAFHFLRKWCKFDICFCFLFKFSKLNVNKCVTRNQKTMEMPIVYILQYYLQMGKSFNCHICISIS